MRPVVGVGGRRESGALQSAEWKRLRSEWIAGPSCSLRTFADAHGVSYSAVLTRARRERWRYARAALQARSRVRTETEVLKVVRAEADSAARALSRACGARRTRPAALVAAAARVADAASRLSATIASLTHAETAALPLPRSR
jgi:hypothetical protein